MAAKGWSEAEVAKEIVAEERLRGIDWSHPDLLNLSDSARLIYAALIDNCSDEAHETLIGVDLIWRNREAYTASALPSDERRGTCEMVCEAVRELTGHGLLLLIDESTIQGGWVRRPWAEVLS